MHVLGLDVLGYNLFRGVAKGGQWGTYVPGRQGTGAPKRGFQTFHDKIAPATDIV